MNVRQAIELFEGALPFLSALRLNKVSLYRLWAVFYLKA